MNRIIDLHTHSLASDGMLSPTALVRLAAENNLSALALTDHDSTDGIDEFISECNKYNIEPIIGTELSTKYKAELHIVGLMIDPSNAFFKQKLDYLQASRCERNEKMIALLNEHGFDITVDDILCQKERASLKNTGRAHMARAMLAKGYVKDTDDAFDRYLSRGKPCYASRQTILPEEAIEMIKQAGGIAILAHPYTISTNKNELTELLTRLKKAGLDGMECYYSEHSPEFKDLCLELCKEFDLLPSGGSDFHGDDKPRKLGICCKNIGIPYSLLEQIKKQKGIL